MVVANTQHYYEYFVDAIKSGNTRETCIENESVLF